jgi:hypothetical protein
MRIRGASKSMWKQRGAPGIRPSPFWDEIKELSSQPPVLFLCCSFPVQVLVPFVTLTIPTLLPRVQKEKPSSASPAETSEQQWHPGSPLEGTPNEFNILSPDLCTHLYEMILLFPPVRGQLFKMTIESHSPKQ